MADEIVDNEPLMKVLYFTSFIQSFITFFEVQGKFKQVKVTVVRKIYTETLFEIYTQSKTKFTENNSIIIQKCMFSKIIFSQNNKLQNILTQKFCKVQEKLENGLNVN